MWQSRKIHGVQGDRWLCAFIFFDKNGMQITQPWRLLGKYHPAGPRGVSWRVLTFKHTKTGGRGRMEDGSKLGRTWTSTFSSEAKRSLTYFSIFFFVFTLSEVSLWSTRVNKPDTAAQELNRLGRNTPFEHILLHGTFNSSSRTASLIPEGI